MALVFALALALAVALVLVLMLAWALVGRGAAVVIRSVASWQCHERTMVMVLALKKVYDEEVVGG